MGLKFILLYFVVISILFYSCDNSKNDKTLLLDKAQLVLDKNPQQTLDYLDSIDSPSEMDEEHYMEYALTSIIAKYRLEEDLFVDCSLVNQAFLYFEEKGDIQRAALAAYFLGSIYLDQEDRLKSVDAYIHSAHYAEIIGDKDLAGKSFNNLGYAYYEEDILDSAMVNYKKALKCFEEARSKPDKKLNTMNNIGIAYDALHQNDSALFYFQKGLTLAKDLNNKNFIFLSQKNLGVSSYELGRYDDAIRYLQSSLDLKYIDFQLGIDQANLYLLKTYNKLHNTKLAKLYVDIVESRVPQIEYHYTTKEIYSALSDYYQQIGNSQKAMYYAQKEKLKKKQIDDENKSLEFLQAEKNFALALQKQHNNSINKSIYTYLITIAVAVILIFLFMIRMTRQTTIDKREADKY